MVSGGLAARYPMYDCVIRLYCLIIGCLEAS